MHNMGSTMHNMGSKMHNAQYGQYNAQYGQHNAAFSDIEKFFLFLPSLKTVFKTEEAKPTSH